MLKLVNRTRNPGSRFTFCADLRDVTSRIPPLLLLRIFSPSLSLSLFFLVHVFRGSASIPDSVAPTMEDSHCLRGLSLPSIAKYTPASPPNSHPPVCARCFLSYASSPTTSTISLCIACRRYVSLMKLTVTMCARDRSYEVGPQPYSIGA